VVYRNICNFLWYGGVEGGVGEGLRSVEVKPSPNQERVLYPAHRSPFIGPGLSGSGLYNVCIVGRVVLPSLATTWPSLCALGALRWVVCGATMTSPGGVGTTLCCKTPRARPTGFYHGPELSVYLAPAPSLRPGPRPQGVSYVQVSVVYIRNIIPIGTRLPRRRSWPYRGGAMRGPGLRF
jgi:hypothetical protein